MNKYEGHLKGPLRAGEGKYIYQGDKYVAAVGFDLDDWDCVMATARLFADAPELLRQRDALLEALHAFRDAIQGPALNISYKRIQEADSKARAAIELCEKGDK